MEVRSGPPAAAAVRARLAAPRRPGRDRRRRLPDPAGDGLRRVAGLPPVVGLWAIGAALLAYAVFGSSRQAVGGPESTTALMTAVVVAPLAAGDPVRYAALAAALAWSSAGCAWWPAARLGFLADLLSEAGPGRLHGRRRRAHDREPAREGHRRPGRGTASSRRSRRSSVGWTTGHPATALLSAGVLAFLLSCNGASGAPSPLIGMLVASAVVAALSLAETGGPARRRHPRRLPASPSRRSGLRPRRSPGARRSA